MWFGGEDAVLTAYKVAIDYSWLLKLVFLMAFTLLMVMIVAWLYTGEQQAERGPISIKSWSPAAAKEAFHAPDPIVTNILDEKSAVCVFYLSYIDRRGRPARVRLLKQRFKLKKLNVRRASSVQDLVGYWNPSHHDSITTKIEEAGRKPDASNLFSAGTSPQRHPETKSGAAPHIDAYYCRESAETEVVCLSRDIAEKLAAAQRKFLEEKFERYKAVAARTKSPKSLGRRREYTELPNVTEDGHYFVEMQFPILPWYVLTDHPDGQVKTTAWLTVLTSIFAVAMQLLYNGLGN